MFSNSLYWSRRTRLLRATPVLLGSLFLWTACDAMAPSSDSSNPLAPEFSHKPTHNPGGGGDGDGDREPSPSTVVTFTDRDDDNIHSDLRGSYTDGDCGVLADFNLTDARLDPDGQYKGKDKRTCGDPRALVFEWDQPADDLDPKDKDTRVDGIFMNIDGVELEIGDDVPHAGQFNVCGRLVFNPDDSGEPNNGSDLLLVNFDAETDTWTVSTQDYPNDKGYCVGDDRLWHMPFKLTIQRK